MWTKVYLAEFLTFNIFPYTMDRVSAAVYS